jgi:hypothetical protein
VSSPITGLPWPVPSPIHLGSFCPFLPIPDLTLTTTQHESNHRPTQDTAKTTTPARYHGWCIKPQLSSKTDLLSYVAKVVRQAYAYLPRSVDDTRHTFDTQGQNTDQPNHISSQSLPVSHGRIATPTPFAMPPPSSSTTLARRTPSRSEGRF